MNSKKQCDALMLLMLSLIITPFFGKAQNKTNNDAPEFLSEMSNITVSQGRDISFVCIVNNLGPYRVAWIKSDSKAILGIHTHMVSVNPRISVTHNGHNTWKLLISHVQPSDSGSYMCQLNTDPMKSLSGYLEVVVPPDILDLPGPTTALLSINKEGETIELFCNATGIPEPTVIWKREGGKNIILRTENREKRVVKSFDGVKLVLANVQRFDMGGYFCIASNGIPPSVSKRFDVYVHFPPTIKAISQLVAAPAGSHVTLECFVEVYPKALNGWYKDLGFTKLHNGMKYNISEEMINAYTWQLNLTIYQITTTDFGAYICSSENALGKNEARIRFQELRLPKPKTTTVTRASTTPIVSVKIQQSYKDTNEVIRPKKIIIVNHLFENITEVPDKNYGVVSQILTSYEHESTQKSHPSAVAPSSRSPRLLTNEDDMLSKFGVIYCTYKCRNAMYEGGIQPIDLKELMFSRNFVLILVTIQASLI